MIYLPLRGAPQSSGDHFNRPQSWRHHFGDGRNRPSGESPVIVDPLLIHVFERAKTGLAPQTWAGRIDHAQELASHATGPLFAAFTRERNRN